MHDELYKQAGLISVLVYLLDNDGSNQKTIINNTKANTITINKIQYLLQINKLVTVQKGGPHNQSLFFLTDKGRKVAEKILEIESIL